MKKQFLSLLIILGSYQFSKAQLSVVEAKLGKGVENRALTEEASTFSADSQVYLWMKLAGGTGAVTVTWKNGEHTKTNNLTVGGNPWRTWAYATPYYKGNWNVSVADEQGNVLKELTFTVE